MKMIIQRSNAKINIGLNVMNKRKDGYHNLEMIMAPISLSDILEISFTSKNGELEIKCNKDEIPTDKRNIIYKMYDAFYDFTKKERKKIKVNLIKNIPLEAGLGGGSSNGAFFLKALNEYYNNILNEKQLILLSKKNGADIPFFIKNKMAKVEGIGEKIKVIPNNLQCEVILIKPNFGITAKEGYDCFEKFDNCKLANLKEIELGLKNNDIKKVKKNIENNLQEAILQENKKLIEFQKRLEKIKEVDFFMSGSGSTYYTLIEKDSEKILKEMKANFKDCFIRLVNLL